MQAKPLETKQRRCLANHQMPPLAGNRANVRLPPSTVKPRAGSFCRKTLLAAFTGQMLSCRAIFVQLEAAGRRTYTGRNKLHLPASCPTSSTRPWVGLQCASVFSQPISTYCLRCRKIRLTCPAVCSAAALSQPLQTNLQSGARGDPDQSLPSYLGR